MAADALRKTAFMSVLYRDTHRVARSRYRVAKTAV
jgi:hypothetical protein